MPAVPFLVLFSGSSGSTWLIGQLRERDDVLVEGEALSRHEGASAQRSFVEGFYGGDGPQARGFKAKVFQMADPPGLRDVLDGFGVRYIHLERANRVKQAVSLITSEELNERSLRLTGKPSPNLRKRDLEKHPELALDAISIRPKLLKSTINAITRREDEIADFVGNSGGGTTRLTYEQLLADPQGFYDDFCDAVGLGRRPLADSDVVKKTDDNLRAAIANFDECAAVLRGTAWEAQLLDGP